MPKLLAKLTPKPIKKPVERIFNKFRYFGFARYCPICRSWLRLFKPYGVSSRPDACCPVCLTFERFRMLWIFLNTQTNLFDGTPKKMLHIAPEPEFVRKFKRIPNLDYLTADLNDPNVMVKMDIENIQYPDNSFDVIYCSHVFEHIPDDYKAMRELSRVLKNDGWAAIMVPINVEKTFEDPTITDPAERLRLFGQNDHVRKYGHDFKERLEQSGFIVKEWRLADIVAERNIVRFGLKEDSVFYCTKAQ